MFRELGRVESFRRETITQRNQSGSVLDCWLAVLGGRTSNVGGRAISELTKTDRVLAEFLGIGLAVVFLVVGMVAKNAADDRNAEDSAAE